MHTFLVVYGYVILPHYPQQIKLRAAAAEASDHLRTKLKPAKAAVNVAIHDTAARRARDKS